MPVLSLDDQLAELWAAGASFTDMGRRLGVSRSIVAGRIDRARKSGDPRFAPRSKPVVAPIAPAVALAPPIVASEPVKRAPRLLVDLGWRDCRWPVALAPDGQRHIFCGQPAVFGRPLLSRSSPARQLFVRAFAFAWRSISARTIFMTMNASEHSSALAVFRPTQISDFGDQFGPEPMNLRQFQRPPEPVVATRGAARGIFLIASG